MTTKHSYEEMEAAFQSYCKHNGGRVYDGVTNTICSICHWDTDKCQHRDEQGKFCSQCGENLKQGK